MIDRHTPADAHAAQLRVYSRMGPERRVELAFEMSERARELAIETIRSLAPALSYAEARHLLWRHLLGEQLFEAAFPDVPPSRSSSGDIEAVWQRARAEVDPDES